MINYTLEKHLEIICKDDQDFCVLDASWKLNKKSLPSALDNIVFNFPHYSLHESSHSQKIIRNIESFLGKERIEVLGPTETWLLLMASYTHDLGMVIAHKDLEKEWASEGFQKYLEYQAQNRIDNQLAGSAKLILSLKNEKIKGENFDWSLPLRIRNAVIIIAADYFRRTHHQQSRDIIKGANGQLTEIYSNFYSSLIPNRFFHLLGEIAFSHGVNFDFLLGNLEYEANGYGSDKIHPRFIAAMLRLGDLLDVDDKRFNPFSEYVMGAGFPDTSRQHREKHAAVRHFLVSPTSIEITTDCKEQNVYRLARSWFDYLETEAENQSKDWTKIAPTSLPGLPPIITKGNIKVLFDGNVLDDKLMNLKFVIKSERALEIFEGGGIYEEPGFVFIREIVQNSLDASKIQLWDDIGSGKYDQILCNHLLIEPNTPTEEIINHLRFPSDIPKEIYASYQINLIIDWDDNNVMVELRDKGCGISRTDLIRMTSQVGDSTLRSDTGINRLKNMPFWLKPTGAFGLGLQSIFFVTDSFIIHTKAEGEAAMEVQLNSPKYGAYSFITNTKLNGFKRGTTTKIKLDKKKLPEFFKNSFAYRIVDQYDYFTTEIPLYLHKLFYLIEKNLGNIDSLNIIARTEHFKKSIYFEQNKEVAADESFVTFDDDKKIRTELVLTQDSFSFVSAINDAKVGSIINMFFHSNEDAGRGYDYNNPLLIRSIEIEDNTLNNWYFKSFFAVKWDLLTPASDKILDVSRSKLNQNFFSDIVTILRDDFIPKITKNCWRLLIKNWDVIKEKYGIAEVENTTFSLILSGRLNDKEFTESKNLELGFPTTKNIHTADAKTVSFKSFLEAKELVIVSGHVHAMVKEEVEDLLQQEVVNKTINKEIIVVNQNNVGGGIIRYIANKYSLNQYWHRDKYLMFLFKKGENDHVDVDAQTRKVIISNLVGRGTYVTSRKTMNRTVIYAISPYNKVLGISTDYSAGFLFYPSFSSVSIISPCASWEEANLLFKKIENYIDKSREELSEQIELHLKESLPEKLIMWVKDHVVNLTKPTTEEIRKAYADLLSEYFQNEKDRFISKVM